MLLAPEFLTLFGVFALAAIAPGADFACVLRESVSYGRRAGILSALGVGSAIMVHVAYTVAGVGLIIAQSIVLFTIVKWCGAAYLVTIGMRSLTARRRPASGAALQAVCACGPRHGATSYGVGFLTNLLNPKATLFFVSLFATIVSHQTPMPVQFAYGAALAVFLALWFSFVAVFLTTRGMRAAFERMGHWIDRVTGLVLIALGVRVALQRAS
ncbi:LysE family transporter [Bradyrhizobium sp. U87765 SZCCT0131]|uniref:LysE family transporter n=1 Tax=unclassified Bradyrhizobium TaxID=2631580 RepID=UPI001BAA2BB3|nr:MULTISPECIES: LysE family transporter [unclassified Bradyrhizobium]MBR1217021.1 LysE family transporter [Bradyrhizobium sp. U87765 SZCCT0131]MBR1259223.1 LysE family transporter [Bradyrhizobium sp. U87765 SZCCT0134]MBR1305364.1 LysE family transporter [Bradyrhizobium sp. U87765 SZCCT0110]MBR1321150.1 LysE family transporter [Bradyrhizobium sp. U87765 SZCCT0109]MBR1350196.1 LysE family transporter [Bradyrhizobium sp. U87765 SZCCT0048]